jgi:formylglycine-generating enzyme required for sulfatase activity
MVTFTDNTGVPGTTYYYQVRAFNSQGNSTYSNAVIGTPQINAPTGLTATMTSLSSIALSWQDNSSIEQGYKVERKTGSGGSWSVIYTAGSNAESYTNTGLTANTTYYYRVRGYAGTSYSGYSNESSATTTYTAGYVQSFPLGTTGLTIEMVWVPAGSFLQGAYSGESGSSSDELPQHWVTFANGFWMGKNEVTQAQWEAIAGSWSFYFDGHPDYPAENVSWNDITNTFLPALNSQSGGNVWRLPSESEWEYGCRAGTTTRYYWGDDLSYSQIGSYAWYSGNSGSTTHTVGTKQPNSWNLYDMSGNVYEWCEDYWHSNYTGAPTNGSAWLSPSSSFRVLRGGSWSGSGINCRSANRYYGGPSSRGGNYGFRLVRSS